MRRARKVVSRASAWLGRSARRAREAHGLVLMYHRIANSDRDPWRLCVSPANFEAHMRVLRETCDVVPLVRLRQELRTGRRSRPVAAVTFDDGYRDNLTVAKPILEQHGVPATVFVITGFTGRADPFWWDRLAAVILGAERLPTSISLGSGATSFCRQHAALAEGSRAGASARCKLHQQLWTWMADLPDTERATALGAIEHWAGATAIADPWQAAMTHDELRELAAGGLVELGAHTVTHPRLSRLPTVEKSDQIRRSREDLEHILGRAPRCFSYPNGDYDPECIDLVRRAGFELACDSRADLVWASTDRHALPRISARDESGAAFSRRLGWDVLA